MFINTDATQMDLSLLLEAAQSFPCLLEPRKSNSHKGTYGTLAVIGGGTGMTGAVVLAASAAMYQGCGKVWAGFNQPLLPFAMIPDRAEIMLATASQLQQREDISAWVLGCGLGLDSVALANLATQLQRDGGQPLLLDADALTLLARHPELAAAAKCCPYLVLTPHPAEAARLLACTTEDVQVSRHEAALLLADRYQAYVVLKGEHSLVASPDGSVYVNKSGNAGLATAGSGDVLSGMIGALLAQGIAPAEAVCGGVWLHGAAADVLKAMQVGEIGLLAGEIAPAARWLRNRLVSLNDTLA